MPDATVSTEGTREELKTVEGGYVVIRPLPYGERLAMRDRASRMSMEADRKRSNRDATTKIDIDMLQAQSRTYEFAQCIVDHNLEDKSGTPLDFKKPDTLNILDPKIGSEIEELLDKYNEIESEEDLANLKSQLSTSTTGPPNNGSTEGNLTEVS